MKTFLKILLIAAILFVAIKLSPFIFLVGLAGLGTATVLGTLGLSLLGLLLGVFLALAVLLAPFWIPVLAIVGIICLFRRKEPNVVTA